MQQTKEIKVVLLGDSGVGKSSLLVRFVDNEFSEKGQPTLGAAFLSKTIVIDEKPLKFQIWDTAGQEKYKAILPLYYRDAKVAILVYDVNDKQSFEGIKEWTKQLQESGPIDQIRAIVANKCDLECNVSQNIAEEFALSTSALFFTTSCKDNVGVSVFKCFIRKPLIKLGRKYFKNQGIRITRNHFLKTKVQPSKLAHKVRKINKNQEAFAVELNQFILSLIQMDQLFQSFDQFMKIHLTSYLPHQQSSIIQQWDEFLALLQTAPLDYGKIYSLINQVNVEENRERSSARVNSRLVSNNTTSPRINISQQKTTVSKVSHLDQLQSPKINLSSQQQAALQKSQKTQVEDFNRLLLISKIKEQLFNYAVSTDKLYAIARMTTIKEVHRVSRSPNRQISNKQKTSNQSVEHYRIIA